MTTDFFVMIQKAAAEGGNAKVLEALRTHVRKYQLNAQVKFAAGILTVKGVRTIQESTNLADDWLIEPDVRISTADFVVCEVRLSDRVEIYGRAIHAGLTTMDLFTLKAFLV